MATNKVTNKILRLMTAPVVTALLAASCSGRETPGQFVPLQDSQWVYGDTLRFEGLAGDSAACTPQRLLLSVEHSDGYGWANLWLEATYLQPDSTLCRDTVEVQLADAYGVWLGNGLGPTLVKNDTLTLRGPLKESSAVTLRHIMRVDTLANIERVGLTPLP